MRKIISLFVRDFNDGNKITNKVTPGAEWVIAGQGVPTRKFDGTCCLIRGGEIYARYDAKNGKTPPLGFEPAQDPDPVTGHWPGWIKVKDQPEYKYHRAALYIGEPVSDGTYELVGPKINGNPEAYSEHVLVRHGIVVLDECERTFEGIRAFLETLPYEGIVWHHPDGRMVKVKLRDFGLKRIPWGSP